MSKIYEDNTLTIGNTPLVRLNKVSKGNVLAKIEARNPSFSVKCRIGSNMIWEADWSTLTQYEEEDYTVASQELACSAGFCEVL